LSFLKSKNNNQQVVKQLIFIKITNVLTLSKYALTENLKFKPAYLWLGGKFN